jgi:hypothetical protein
MLVVTAKFAISSLIREPTIPIQGRSEIWDLGAMEFCWISQQGLRQRSRSPAWRAAVPCSPGVPGATLILPGRSFGPTAPRDWRPPGNRPAMASGSSNVSVTTLAFSFTAQLKLCPTRPSRLMAPKSNSPGVHFSQNTFAGHARESA